MAGVIIIHTRTPPGGNSYGSTGGLHRIVDRRWRACPFARRFEANGNPVGGEFKVTPDGVFVGPEAPPAVAASRGGSDHAIAWTDALTSQVSHNLYRRVNVDSDEDGIADSDDNCPNTFNPDQTDTDGDKIGDACDPDDDNDGVEDGSDNDPLDSNVCRDLDGDGCDDCSSGTDDPSQDGQDTDGDGLCDVGDPDDDNDGLSDAVEIGLGTDPLDADTDNDGIEDGSDSCPLEDASGNDTNDDGCIDSVDDMPALIESVTLPQGIENSLLSTVNNAQKSLEQGSSKAAINQMKAFINNVEAQRGKKISDEEAQMLIDFAESAIGQI